MVTELQQIKYTKSVASVTCYDTGIADWAGVYEAYKDQVLRGKVVCRMDAASFLNVYFSEETVRVYRPVLLMMAKGLVINAEQFSGAIKDFIKMDAVFAERINDLFHSCPEDVSFGTHIVQSLADVIVNVESKYRTFFRGRPEVVICVSDGWLYYSFDDMMSGPLLPDKAEQEVLSHVKNWNGVFRYR